MTAYGLNLAQNIFSINLGTGAWTFAAATSIQGTGLAYDCDADNLYIIDQANGDLYVLDPTDGSITGPVATNPMLGAGSYGLAYDSALQILFACFGDKTYTIDKNTGLWTELGSTGLGITTIQLVYDCANDKLYGLGQVSGFTYNMYTVDVVTGAWTLIGSTGTLDVVALGLLWDQTDGTFYGSGISGGEPATGSMFKINIGTGAWTFFASTGTSSAGAMAIVGLPCCCVLESTLVPLANGLSIPISELKAGALVMNFRSEAVRVAQNVCTGRESEFVKLPANSLGRRLPSADLLIRADHPVLYEKKVVPCQHLPHARVEELPQKARVFTLITETETFVNMQGLMVGTWSDSSFQQYRQNNPIGRKFICKPQ